MEITSWTLKHYGPKGQTLKQTYSNAEPYNIGSPFTIDRLGDGAPSLFTFMAVPDGPQLIGVRDIMQLELNGSPVFYGYVADLWNPSLTYPRRYRVLGGRRLLDYAIMDGTTYTTPTNVKNIVWDLLASLAPQAVKHDPNRIDDPNITATLGPSEGVTLSQVFDALLAVIGDKTWRWGVGPDGYFYFKQFGAAELPADEHLLYAANDDVEKLTTGVKVIVGHDYRGWPIAVDYHDSYGSTNGGAYPDTDFEMRRAVAVPADDILDVEPVTGLDADDAHGCYYNPSNSSWVCDDKYTYFTDRLVGTRWQAKGQQDASTCLTGIGNWGFRKVHFGSVDDAVALYIDVAAPSEDNSSQGAILKLWKTDGLIEEVAAYDLGTGFKGLIDLRGIDFDTLGVVTQSGCTNIGRWNIIIRELHLYRAGDTFNRYAPSLLSAPYSHPQRLRWRGYVEPFARANLGGDILDVSAWKHYLGTDEQYTEAVFAQHGEPNALAVKRAIERATERVKVEVHR